MRKISELSEIDSASCIKLKFELKKMSTDKNNSSKNKKAKNGKAETCS